MKKKIFIDTDMGNDDIMAIALLYNEPQVTIVGFSTVSGVSTGENGYNNLTALLAYLNKSAPICLGYQKALEEVSATFPQRDVDRANKLTLLRNLTIPKISNATNNILTVENYIFKKIVDNKITLLALGPLTNIAKTIEKYEELFIESVEEIVIMGGGIQKGNVPPYYFAEYNIWLDPEAAKIVFNSGIPITMIGIDATNFVKVTKKFTRKVEKIYPQNKIARILREIIINNDSDFSAYYDPLAAYILLNKNCIAESIRCGISVSLNGPTRGQTVVDKKRKNVEVVLKVNADIFYQNILTVLKGGERNE